MSEHEFRPDDIPAYLNQELPGFEPTIMRDPRTMQAILRLRTPISYASHSSMAEDLYLPLRDRGRRLKADIDEQIRTTREELIQKLGLQGEINAQIEAGVEAGRRALEARAFQEAYAKAYERALRELATAQEERAPHYFHMLFNKLREGGRDV